MKHQREQELLDCLQASLTDLQQAVAKISRYGIEDVTHLQETWKDVESDYRRLIHLYHSLNTKKGL